MSGQTVADQANVDNTRGNRWECAVCGAIGPNIEYDTLEEHARDNHPEKWGEFEDATGIGEPVNVTALVGCIAVSIVAAVGTFAATSSVGWAIIGYLVVACVSYVALWVTGYA